MLLLLVNEQKIESINDFRIIGLLSVFIDQQKTLRGIIFHTSREIR